MSTIKVDTYLTRGGASEIAIDKLKGVTAAATINVVAEGGTNTTSLQQGLLKSWCNFEQSSSHTTRDSFNISGLTDDGAGLTDLSYTSNFNNTGYVAGCHGGRQAVDSASAYFLFPLNDGSPANSDYTTSRTATTGGYSSGTSSVLDQYDLYLALVSVAGDLA